MNDYHPTANSIKNDKTSEQHRYTQSQFTFPLGIMLAFHIVPSVQRYLSTSSTTACCLQPYPIHRPTNQHWDFLRPLPSCSYCTVQHSSTWARSNTHLLSHSIDGSRSWGERELQTPWLPSSFMTITTFTLQHTFAFINQPKASVARIFNFWSSLRTFE